MRYAMIMAGGVGTRLWPMSRRARPKQLIPFLSGRSLLQVAADRLDGVVPAERRLICTSEGYRDVIRATMPEFTNEQILGEPVGRNTVNAVGLTAAVLAKRDPGAVFAVLTADHIIEPQDEFRRRMETGFALVEDDPNRFVTFSITPTFPATGYGYVERGAAVPQFEGAFGALRFVEKPDAATAQSYLDAGTFSWNSGMFVYGAGAYLEALRRFLPDAAKGLETIADAWDTPDQDNVLAAVYPTLPSTSVDYGVMEPAAADEAFKICTVPLAVQWTDVGSWPAFGETLAEDAAGCRASGKAVHLDSERVLTVSDDPDHLIATIGCSDLIVVHTPDVTLVCRTGDDQRVKDVAGMVDESLR